MVIGSSATQDPLDFNSGVVGTTCSGITISQPTPIPRQFDSDLGTLIASQLGVVQPLLHMATSKLSSEERARLWHYRLAHPAPAVPVRMSKENLAMDIDYRLLT